MFKNAIVRRPCRTMISGITSAPELGAPDFEAALRQHDAYIAALESCGVAVTVLPALEEFPDSCFVEDPAVLTPHCAIITNPGAPSRKGETAHILPAVRRFYPDDRIEYIRDPGTLEGGDVMMVGNHFFVGQSARTNAEGFRQFAAILAKYGMTCSAVPLRRVLHLKTGAVYLGDDTMLLSGEFLDFPDFARFRRLTVPSAAEAYAANNIRVNDTLIMPAGYPETEELLRNAGFSIMTVDSSEYKKIDGGLSCLSLRF